MTDPDSGKEKIEEADKPEKVWLRESHKMSQDINENMLAIVLVCGSYTYNVSHCVKMDISQPGLS